MPQAQTIPAKYLFLDVVGFTHNRSVEAQTDIVHSLNAIVDGVISELEIDRERLLFLPTGDGICITLLNIENPFDIHMQIALGLLEGISEHNEKTVDEMRKFQTRIGINSNTDNLVTDINGKQNIAGAGINMAARVMSKADGGQILVSETVYETLRYREKYMDLFRSYLGEVKHGVRLSVYQYISEEHFGLNTEVPTAFRKAPAPDKARLTKQMAYYIAHAIFHKDFVLKHRDHGQNSYNLVVMLWFLSVDSVGLSEATEISPYPPQIYGEGKLNLKEIYEYYDTLDFRLIWTFAEFVAEKFRHYSFCFDQSSYTNRLLFINDAGREKLKAEYIDIWREFNLDSPNDQNA